MRTETVIGDTRDFGIGRRVNAANWRALRAVGEHANQRLCDNPDEWVWKNVKADRIGRAGIKDADDLKTRALATLHRLQKLPHLIRGFFADPNLRYITA